MSEEDQLDPRGPSRGTDSLIELRYIGGRLNQGNLERVLRVSRSFLEISTTRRLILRIKLEMLSELGTTLKCSLELLLCLC